MPSEWNNTSSFAAPLAEIAAYPLQRPFADVADQPGFLGHCDEVAGRNLAAFGVKPTQQRLAPRQSQGPRVVLWLVVDFETRILDRLSELHFQG